MLIFKRRIIYVFSYEIILLVIIVVVLSFIFYMFLEVIGVFGIVMVVILVIWNMVFNYFFEKFEVKRKLKRIIGVCVFYVIGFEGGLMFVIILMVVYVM